MAAANLLTSLPPVRIALIESLFRAFANTGEAVFRNLVWATAPVNARGGVKLTDGAHPLLVQRYDNKGQNEEALAVLRFQIDDGVTLIAQCNPSPYCDDADEGDQGRQGAENIYLIRQDYAFGQAVLR